ncbi:actin-interacting protein 1 [Trichomonascus vanleenenianus]|uniref:Aip1p n=1 Tax=Trichomonascus vanleenenianus TaxID=2268995 RepID=UPI003ECB1C98
MTFELKSTWASQPSTTRGVSVHLSYDKKSDRIAYASNRSIIVRSVADPAKAVQYKNHTAATTVAKFSPSGFYVASGDENGNVKIWDCVGEDMVTKGEYQVISGRINDLAWDADSQRIIAVGNGKERFGHCFTWDSGNTVGEISGHTEVVNAVAIRPVRPYKAVTVADDSSLVFYNGPPFKFGFASRGNHSSFVQDVQFSPDGQYIVSVGSDKKVYLYEGKTGESPVSVACDHTGSIFAVAWSPDSSKFATASADGSVKLWEIAGSSAKVVHTWQLDRVLANQQVGVVFVADDRLVSLSYNGNLNYLSVGNSAPDRVIYGHQKSVTGVAQVGGLLLSTGADGSVYKWETESGVAEPITEGNPHTGYIVDVVPSGSSLYSAGWDDTVKRITASGFEQSAPIGGQPKGISANAAGAVAVVTESDVVTFVDMKRAQKISGDGFTGAIAINSQGVVAAGQSSGGAMGVVVYSKSGEKTNEIVGLRAQPTYLAFSPDDKYLAVGDGSGKVLLYDAHEWKIVTSRWAFNSSKITSISWHKDANHVVVGSIDTNVIVYRVDVPSKNIKQLNAHQDGVASVAWLDDSTVVTGGLDGVVKLWHLQL